MSSNFQDFTLAQQLVTRRWSHALDPYELAVVNFVLDRTLGWGKSLEVVKVKQATGEPVSEHWGRLPMSRNKALEVMSTLVRRGVLFQQEGDAGGPSSYGVNLGWEPDMGLPKPRNKAKSGVHATGTRGSTVWNGEVHHVDQGGPPHGPGVVHRVDPVKKSKKELYFEKSNLRTARAVPAPSSLESKIAEGEEKNRAAVKRKTSAARGSPSAAKLFAVWREAFTETFPDDSCVAWTAVEGKIIRDLSGRKLGAPVADIIELAVRDWSAIIASEFKWMRRPPDKPEPRFFIRHIRAFAAHQGRDAAASPERALKRMMERHG